MDVSESHSGVVCVNCREGVAAGARRCPHCGELQPSPLIDGGIAVGGVFLVLIGIPLGGFAEGFPAIAGYGGVLIGIALVVGAVTHYLDAQNERTHR
ncbi:MAG: hypothetical protein A07HR60_02180 [uncultured archaeon A07HR60]|nr:MAG: hypothetical protein A07HR60_02180 [uncultured archaeon A07HR60]